MLITILILLLSQVESSPDSVHSKISSTHMVTADALCLAVRVPLLIGILGAQEHAPRQKPSPMHTTFPQVLKKNLRKKTSRVGTVFRRSPQSALQTTEAHQILVLTYRDVFCNKKNASYGCAVPLYPPRFVTFENPACLSICSAAAARIPERQYTPIDASRGMSGNAPCAIVLASKCIAPS